MKFMLAIAAAYYSGAVAPRDWSPFVLLFLLTIATAIAWADALDRSLRTDARELPPARATRVRTKPFKEAS